MNLGIVFQVLIVERSSALVSFPRSLKDCFFVFLSYGFTVRQLYPTSYLVQAILLAYQKLSPSDDVAAASALLPPSRSYIGLLGWERCRL